MGPARRKAAKPRSSGYGGGGDDVFKGEPPAPFKRPPEALESFVDGLSEKHVYITHVDSKPAAFKRKIFLVPVAMNVAVLLLFVWRMYSILPWYWQLVVSALGYQSEATFPASQATWAELAREVAKRGITMFIDFVLVVFVWPWPVEFAAGQRHGNPMRWRWRVGFRQNEIYVRRSRDWDQLLGDIFKDADDRKILVAYVQQATSPLLQEQKTGYLLMNGSWDLDWECMVYAHALVDEKTVAIEAFKTVILVHHKDYGWLCYDIRVGSDADSDEKRRQVFAFRDALTAIGKADRFYRWVEIVQLESTQAGGFGPDKQEAAATKIRDMFASEKIDFDELSKEVAGV